MELEDPNNNFMIKFIRNHYYNNRVNKKRIKNIKTLLRNK